MVRHAAAWGIFVALVAGVAVFASRRSSNPPRPDDSLADAPRQPAGLPRLDGSDSARDLLRVVAATRLGVPYHWQTGPNGTRSVAPAAAPPDRAPAPLQAHVFDRLRTSNTRQAYVNLAEGRRDLIITVRPPDADERQFAREAGTAVRAEPVARLPLVVLLHRDNPVHDLSTDALRDVYTGRVTDWSRLGGASVPVCAYRRRPDAVTTTVFAEKVMRGAPASPATRLVPAGDDRLPELVGGHVGAIAVTLALPARFARSAALKPARIDGVSPDSPHYPLVTDLLVVTRADLRPTDPAARLRTWLLSPDARDTLEECGYVPLSPSR